MGLPDTKPYKIFLSAGDLSGDRHGGELVRALLAEAIKRQKLLALVGIGGEAMRASGLKVFEKTERLSVMGFWEILSHLPRIFGILDKSVEVIRDEKPDALVFIDYPGFHFRLAKKLIGKKIWPKLSFYWIPPKVWVWKAYRASFLQKHFKNVFSIFPFEQKWFAERGVRSTYVGNPTFDSYRELHKKTISNHSRCIGLWLGSRGVELRNHFSLASEWVAEWNRRFPLDTFKIAVAEESELPRFRAWKDNFPKVVQDKMRLEVCSKPETAWQDVDAALVKSGTSSLEACLSLTPHVVFYRAGVISTFIVKYVIGFKGPLSLVNWAGASLGLGKDVVTEWINRPAKDFGMLDELSKLLDINDPKSKEQMSKFQKIRDSFFSEMKSAETVAYEIWNTLEGNKS